MEKDNYILPQRLCRLAYHSVMSVFSVVSVFLLTTVPAFAAGGDIWDGQLVKLFGTARAIAIPLAALSFTYGGFMFFGLNIFSNKEQEKRMSQGRQIMVISAIALACLLLLPAIFKGAVSTFEAIKYEPPM